MHQVPTVFKIVFTGVSTPILRVLFAPSHCGVHTDLCLFCVELPSFVFSSADISGGCVAEWNGAVPCVVSPVCAWQLLHCEVISGKQETQKSKPLGWEHSPFKMSIASRLGSCPWAGSQFGPVIGRPFPQSLIHLCPCTSCRQEKS